MLEERSSQFHPPTPVYSPPFSPMIKHFPITSSYTSYPSSVYSPSSSPPAPVYSPSSSPPAPVYSHSSSTQQYHDHITSVTAPPVSYHNQVNNDTQASAGLFIPCTCPAYLAL